MSTSLLGWMLFGSGKDVWNETGISSLWQGFIHSKGWCCLGNGLHRMMSLQKVGENSLGLKSRQLGILRTKPI